MQNTTGEADGARARSVRGSVVLITGAGHGMGRATARLFGAEGAAVAVTDIDTDAATAVAREITGAGGKAVAWRLDVADKDAVFNTVQAVAADLGGLDIVINNAGVSGRRPLDHPEYDENWTRLLEVLLSSQQRIIRAALPHLRRSRAPRIVNIASTEALGGTSGNTAYAAAKAGVAGMTRTLAVELGREGITVNCICPGPILTELTKHISEADRDKYARRRTALGRYGRPEEVAHVTLSLCLPGCSYITGTVIPVDGGLVARNA